MAFFTFDGAAKLIIVGDDVDGRDFEVRDVYSRWKEWMAIGDNSKYEVAFRSVAGDPISTSQTVSPYIFLNTPEGWRIRPDELDHEMHIAGNLYSEDPGLSMFVPTLGGFTVAVTIDRSSASITTMISGGVDQTTIQAALTAQGYTTVRAPKLDRLDVDVSSRAEPGQGLTSAQAAALALLDVAVSSRAEPGQGLSPVESNALMNILSNADVPSSEVARLVWERVVDGTLSAEQSVRLINAVLGGKVAGAGTGLEVFRNPNDTKNRVMSTVDADGNRINVVRDLT